MIEYILKLSILAVVFVIVYKLIIYPFGEMIQLQLKYGQQTRIFFRPLTGAIGMYQQGFQNDGFSFKQFSDLTQSGQEDIRFIVLNTPKQPYILLTDPELIKQFLQTQDNYKQIDFAPSFNLLLAQGLLMTKNEKWKMQRALVGNSFHYEALKGRVPLIKEITEEVLKTIKSGEVQKIVHLCEIITSEIMIKSFFSSDMKGRQIDGRSVGDVLVETIQNGILILGTPFFAIKMLIFGNNFALYKFQGKMEKKFLMNAMKLRQLATEIIEKRIDSRSKTQSNEIKDFLDIYVDAYISDEEKYKNSISDSMRITKNEIIDQFNSLFFAGTDTTGNITGVCLYLFAAYPQVQKQAREELFSHFKKPSDIQHSDLVKLEYLMAVINEALRLYGPANYLVPRIATKDLMIQDLQIKKGYNIGCFFFMNMINQKYFDQPEEFIPERWIGSAKPLNQQFVYVPFSSGPRNCIGQHMAVIETQIILAYFLMNFDVLLNPDVKFTMKFKFVHTPGNDKLVQLRKL